MLLLHEITNRHGKSWAMNSSTKATTIALPTPITTSFSLTTVPPIRPPPITATVRPTPPVSIPCAAASTIIANNKKKSSPFSDDNSIWTIPPVPPTSGSSNNCSGDGGGDGGLGGGSSSQDPPPPISPTAEDNSNDSSSPPPPPPPPAIGGGPWSPSLFRPVSSSPSSAFHTPPPVVKPVVRPPPFPSPQLPCVLPPPPLAYLTDVSTPSASTQSTTVSNVDSEAVMAGATTAAVAVNNTKEVFPSPPIAPIAPSSVATISHHPQAGVSPSGISRLSSGSGGSGSAREAILCNSCGQLHDPHAAHVYDYSETVDADLLCRICRQPLVDPIDTKCGHTFCTPCLKSHLVVQALCPEDKQIINYLECQQSSNLVKRLLDKLLVICPNSEHCDEVLSRCDLESHLAYWCRGTVVPCSNAKTGCQFRAARALQTEHRRECRFQPRAPGTTTSSGGSPVVRPIATKSVVRFGPMPVRRVAVEAPLMSAGVVGGAFEEGSSTSSPPTALSASRGGGGVAVMSGRSTSPIRDCEVTAIELPWKPNASLGISFVGGSDTPLLCIVIQEIYLDGIVAMDGRLRPGDQILEANGIDLTQATHHQARTALTSIGSAAARSFELTVYRERAASECAGLGGSGKRHFGSAPENPFEREEILHINLMKRLDKRLGIKLVGKKNLPGVYILGLVPDSEADLDGRLYKDDRILEINGVDLREGTQEEAANIIRTAEERVALVVARVVRPQTPDIIRTASGEIFMDFGSSGGGTSVATRSPGTSVPPPVACSAALPPSLKSPSTRLCREQEITVEKMPGESLGMTVAGGVASQRGDTPVYITNLVPTGVLGRAGQLAKGDVLLAVNEVELLGLSHEKAVEALKATRKSCTKVTIRVLEGPETGSGRENFLPSWLYWLQLPRYCQIPRTIVLLRTANGSLGFSIVGGNTTSGAADASASPLTAFSRRQSSDSEPRHPQATLGSSSVTSSPQPIVVKSIVPGSPAHRDGRLKCGDLILAVNQYPLTDVSHAHAVALLKHCVGDVHIRVVSWPGTIV
ncbi:Ligand of Numb protein X 2 [Taenia crassiceps]|uniref:Ligand of Numb protein X 2 n=1 Tax=Taenia crassiceps TaxID=6207 RepID=A0ABR4QGQ1_9CEST